MPNYCDYVMKIKGRKKNCQKWIQKIKSYDEENHFFRMALDEPQILDEGGDPEDYSMTICGACAWSLDACCRGDKNSTDLFAVNTKDLDLEMEAYSEEQSMGFQEHYIYKHGECIADECEFVDVYWWDRSSETFDEFRRNYDLDQSVTEDMVDDDDNYRVGGFPNFGKM